MTWASAPVDAAAVARDVSDRADGVSGLVDPAPPAHAPTGAVAAGDHRSMKRGCAPTTRGTKKAMKGRVAWIGAAGMAEHFGHERLKVYQ